MATQENTKVNVKGGRYVGKKWFIKLAYKTIETDVEFFDNKISISQGQGFATVKNKFTTDIVYNNISFVEVKRKYSVPNIVFAICAAAGALITQVWAALLIAAVVFFVGSTAVVSVQYSGGCYEIPTEFKSDAEELQTKINTAISQSKK